MPDGGFTDTERLDLLLEMGARVAICADGGYRVCRNEYGRVRWFGRMQPDQRGAIDTVLRERVLETCETEEGRCA